MTVNLGICVHGIGGCRSKEKTAAPETSQPSTYTTRAAGERRTRKTLIYKVREKRFGSEETAGLL